MNNALKATKLDFSLMKPYMKTLLFSLLFPIIMSAVNRSLVNGISFAMCFAGITAGYTFSITEKNGMERLYGILPISKKHMVIGRYLYTCTMGLLTLTISLIVHTIVLNMIGTAVSSVDIITATITGFIMFSLYTVFLLPGYYKYGSIKGRFFMFLPVTAYLAVLFLSSKVDFENNSVVSSIISNPLIFLISVVLICIVAFLLSIIVSIRILQNKEV